MSKFKGILDAAKNRDDEAGPSRGSSPSPALRVPSSKGEGNAPASKRGRKPTGKRSDADFIQVTAYIQQATHKDVKRALLDETEGKDFSDLVGELLTKWLKSRK